MKSDMNFLNSYKFSKNHGVPYTTKFVKCTDL